MPELIIAGVYGGGFGYDRGMGKLRVRQELLLSPYGDGEDELARVVRHNFFDSVYFDLGSWRIAVIPKRSYVGDVIVAAPYTSWVDVVTREHSRYGFGPNRLNTSVRLRHGVDKGAKWNPKAPEMSLLVSFVVG